jgi:hypothetical protein
MSAEKRSIHINQFNLFTPDKKVASDYYKTPRSHEKENKIDNSPFYLYHSPSSLEQYIESFNRKKVRLTREICGDGYEKRAELFPAVINTTSSPITSHYIDHEIKTLSAKNISLETIGYKRERSESKGMNSPYLFKKLDIDNQSTLFSTSKKHRRFRKTQTQIEVLQEYVTLYGTNWSKELVKEVSRKCNMKQSVVYKWIWDQKNK